MRHVRLAFLSAALCAANATSVRAHAILIDSVPAPDGVVPSGHVAIRLRYNSRIDVARSRLTLTLPNNDTQILRLDPAPPAGMLTAAADLGPGSHSLRWQVLAIDGHITRGDIAFTATAGAAATATR